MRSMKQMISMCPKRILDKTYIFNDGTRDLLIINININGAQQDMWYNPERYCPRRFANLMKFFEKSKHYGINDPLFRKEIWESWNE